tara:strand:+ start:898 stop:1107 length:210 start_codon:yes stop_codon:yes gene_type:complete
MTWEDIMKKKKGTPWPKKIYYPPHDEWYLFVKQKAGKGTYRLKPRKGWERPTQTIKVWKEDAIKMQRRR